MIAQGWRSQDGSLVLLDGFDNIKQQLVVLVLNKSERALGFLPDQEAQELGNWLVNLRLLRQPL